MMGMNDCSKCGSRYVINKFFMLCKECNNERLHGSKFGKQYEPPKTQRKSLNPKQRLLKNERLEKRRKKIQADEEFYEKCFYNSDHRCEECGARLNEEFRDDEGNVACRWRYSHILAKSIAPELRHNTLNVNNLCLKHHQQWDFGDKESMKIYSSNQERIKNMKK